ncbi:MAG: hypothetical protein K2I74_01060 [Treponemataceae bacterium]|nr:hypothetical protein [Treponemataceae bacterium]
MKKLFFAAACAIVLASCASTPSGTAAAPRPIARESADTPTNNPPTDGEIIVAESTTGTREVSPSPADESNLDAGQTSDSEIAHAENTPDENDVQKTESIAARESDDTQTDGTDTAHNNADVTPTRVTDADEIIAEADILPVETARYNTIAMANHFLEPEIFDEPDPDIPVITISDVDTIPMQRQAASAPTETTESKHQLPQNTDERANQADENDAPQNTTNSPQNATATENHLSELNAQGNAMQLAAQSTPPPAQNANILENRQSETDAQQNITQSAAQNVATPAQNETATANRQSESDAQHSAMQPAAQSTATPAQNTNAAANRPSETAVPRSATHYTATADDAHSEESATPHSQIITPSRRVTIKNNQYLDVVYPGSGWVYLGETEENRDTKKEPIVSYFGRKLGTTDTTFSLRSRKPGKTLLHFYKNDALTGQYIDDYLEVSIENESAAAGQRTTAPAYAQVVPPKPTRQTRQSYENAATDAKTETGLPKNDTERTAERQPVTPTPAAQQPKAEQQKPVQNTPPAVVSPTADERGVRTVIQTTESAPGGDTKPPAPAPSYAGATVPATEDRTQPAAEENGADLLERAKRAYADKQYENALDLVQRHLDDATEKIDEALFLQGQILEADSSVKSIRSAIDSYESLTKNYPMSALWKKANNRIIYLKRFYIEIR